MEFKISAYNKQSGKTETIRISADNEADAFERAKQRGYQPLEILGAGAKVSAPSGGGGGEGGGRRSLVVVVVVLLLAAIGGAAAYHVREQKRVEDERERFLAWGRAVVVDMGSVAQRAEGLQGLVLMKWNNAIELREDFSSAVSSFLIREHVSLVKPIKDSLGELEQKLRSLDAPPPGFETHYQKAVETFGMVQTFAHSAMSPSGSLISYRESCDRSSTEIARRLNELKILFKL